MVLTGFKNYSAPISFDTVMQTGLVHKTNLQECCLGVKTGLGHTSWLLKHEIGKLKSLFRRKGDNSAQKRLLSASDELQVIGVGFGRTGTVSIMAPILLIPTIFITC